MDMVKISQEFNVDLGVVNALHLAAFNLYARDYWHELTEKQQHDVVSLLVAKYQFERMRHKIMEFSCVQQSQVAALLTKLEESETD